MTYWITFLLGIFVSFLTWLVATKKVPLPLLFETGLSSIAFGLLLMACSIMEEKDPTSFGPGFMVFGAVAIVISMRRQRKKREREMRFGDPKVVDIDGWGK